MLCSEFVCCISSRSAFGTAYSSSRQVKNEHVSLSLSQCSMCLVNRLYGRSYFRGSQTSIPTSATTASLFSMRWKFPRKMYVHVFMSELEARTCFELPVHNVMKLLFRCCAMFFIQLEPHAEHPEPGTVVFPSASCHAQGVGEEKPHTHWARKHWLQVIRTYLSKLYTLRYLEHVFSKVARNVIRKAVCAVKSE